LSLIQHHTCPAPDLQVLPNDQQNHPRYEAKHDDNDLEKPNPTVNRHIECLPGYVEELALDPVREVTTDGKDQGCEDQDAKVQDRAPHEE
jgi:hypothetical protein